MGRRIISVIISFLLVFSIMAPDAKVSAKGFVIGIDEYGNEEPNVNTLTGVEEGGDGWSLYVDCDDDEEWTAKANKPWIKLDGTSSSYTSGTGSESFSVYLKENTSGGERKMERLQLNVGIEHQR